MGVGVGVVVGVGGGGGGGGGGGVVGVVEHTAARNQEWLEKWWCFVF